MKVKIKDYQYLLDHRGEGPTVNERMLFMGGETFEIEDDYIEPEKYYNYGGWSWLGDWLMPLDPTEALQVPENTTKLSDVFLEKFTELTLPNRFSYIVIKSPYVQDLDLGSIKILRSSTHALYVKFDDTSSYAVNNYAGTAPSTITHHSKEQLITALGQQRVREEDAFDVVHSLARILKEMHHTYIENEVYDLYRKDTTDIVSHALLDGKEHISGEHQTREFNSIVSNLVSGVSNINAQLGALFSGVHYIKKEGWKFAKLVDVLNGTSAVDKYIQLTSDNNLSASVLVLDTVPDGMVLNTCVVTGVQFVTEYPKDYLPVLHYVYEERSCERTGREILKRRTYNEVFEQFVERMYYHDIVSTDVIGEYYKDEFVHPDYIEAQFRVFENIADDIDGMKFLSNSRIEYQGRTIYIDDENIIHDYDYEPDLYYFGEGLRLGVELEIDGGGESHEKASFINGILGWEEAYCMHDGSLNEGFEIATAPMTLEYHTSIKQRYVDAFYAASKLDYRSHDTSTCGIHIHLDRRFFGRDRRTQNLKATYMALIIERNWADIVKFSRRSYGRMDQWARNKKLSGDVYHSDTEDDAIDKFGNKYDDGDKYVMLNTNHSHTYELRLFRGTLKPTTYFATLQFVDNLARVAQECPSLAKAQQITFNDIINYKRYDELVAYVESRGIELEGEDI